MSAVVLRQTIYTWMIPKTEAELAKERARRAAEIEAAFFEEEPTLPSYLVARKAELLKIADRDMTFAEMFDLAGIVAEERRLRGEEEE